MSNDAADLTFLKHRLATLEAVNAGHTEPGSGGGGGGSGGHDSRVIRLEEWSKIADDRMGRVETKLDTILERLGRLPSRLDLLGFVIASVAAFLALTGVIVASMGWLETRADSIRTAPPPASIQLTPTTSPTVPTVATPAPAPQKLRPQP